MGGIKTSTDECFLLVSKIDFIMRKKGNGSMRGFMERDGIKKVDLFGLPVALIDVDGLHQYIQKVISDGKKSLIFNVNIHCVNLALLDASAYKNLVSSDLIFCDGDGVRWGLRLLGKKVPAKITYASWMWKFADFCEKNKISWFFLGGKPGVAEKAAQSILTKHPQLDIKGWHHGYFELEGEENDRVIAEINAFCPDVLIVGFGMPIQEEWIIRYKDRIKANVFLPGGAVFDYVSGNLKRAPNWIVKMNMEWLYRLCQDPKRLFKRYVVGNPYFFYRVFLQILSKKKG